MVQSSSGKVGMRSFSVVGVAKHGGCQTKFRAGRYISRSAAGAARKAFNEHCRVKRIRGRCALVVTVQETTQGSKNKQYTYKLRRDKLAEPLVMMEGTPTQFLIEYKIVAKSISNPPPCKKSKKGKSTGKMAKKTSRKVNKQTVANNNKK
jgi:hypothetical protein